MSLLTYVGTWYLTAGVEPRRVPLSAHPSLVPFQNFQTADGWIVVACPKEKFWRRLCVAVGHPGLADDLRFADFASRHAHADELLGLLGKAFAGAASSDWLERLAAAGVPCAPVLSVRDALADPQTAARGLIVETAHPRFGTVRQLRSPVRVGGEPPPNRRAPRRHEDGDALLAALLGYDRVQIGTLAAGGAFGAVPPPS
jgi:crotonobetainyl-CoA:carnitine CoA-transferase CaiB-like acyl-CoA transferase